MIELVYLETILKLVIVLVIMNFAIPGLIVQVKFNFSFDQSFYSFDLESDIGVQRGCISPDMDEYKMIKKLIDNEQSKCIKRINGLDCFKFCSEDKCN